MKKTEAYRFKITGKVQGVFFRASTQEKAQALGVRGFVRNENNGSVYIEAAGGNLDDFEEWLHKGPPAARVEEVKRQKLEGEKEFSEFEVRR